MKQTLWIPLAALIAVGLITAQQPANQVEGKTNAKAKATNPAQSPASRPIPPTVTPQAYPAAQIQAGAERYLAQCGFCHGRDASGGEGGPDLTRSELVAQDARGDKIGPLLRTGRTESGMPAFTLSDADTAMIVAYIHDQKTKFEALGGGRRAVDPSDLATGNAEAGRRYFSGAGGCSGCHSATGDLKGIATRFEGLALLQRMLNPSSGRPAPARPKATVTLASGQIVEGPLASEDEFIIVVTDAAGARQTYEKSAVKFNVNDPLSAHFDQLGKYTDADMHNVYAYLETLK